MTQIINSTQGGAKIKGAEQYAFIDALEKFCPDKIDKSILKPLLSYADDAEYLIDKVIPHLEVDIKTLENIIKHGKKDLELIMLWLRRDSLE